MTLAERLIQRGKNKASLKACLRACLRDFPKGDPKGSFVRCAPPFCALELKHGQVARDVAEAVASITDEPTLQNLHDRAILSSSIEEFAQHL
jgi:hypothetical protein